MAGSRKKVQANPKDEKKVKPQQGIGMRCPDCDGKSHVNNSVSFPEESIQGRYRECDDCGTRFYTEETVKRKTTPRK